MKSYSELSLHIDHSLRNGGLKGGWLALGYMTLHGISFQGLCLFLKMVGWSETRVKKKGYTMGILEKRYTMPATPLMPFLAGVCTSATAMGPGAGAHLPKLNFVEDMLF